MIASRLRMLLLLHLSVIVSYSLFLFKYTRFYAEALAHSLSQPEFLSYAIARRSACRECCIETQRKTQYGSEFESGGGFSIPALDHDEENNRLQRGRRRNNLLVQSTRYGLEHRGSEGSTGIFFRRGNHRTKHQNDGPARSGPNHVTP